METDDGTEGETYALPQQPCLRIRSQVFFPSCWDGKNLDSEDHKSHVSPYYFSSLSHSHGALTLRQAYGLIMPLFVALSRWPILQSTTLAFAPNHTR